ncbi:MAG: carbohydrate ABC transporter permease [Actinobacteria bacterium]|nr:carbohydrate ABC transporter permease [Actinomycetota bacterium]
MNKRMSLGGYIFTRIIIALELIIVLFPVLWIISISFREGGNVNDSWLLIIPKKFTFENYSKSVEFIHKWLGITYQRMFFNSILVTVISIGIAIVISSFAAFGFASYKFKGKEELYTLIIISFMIPAQVLLIPLFLLLGKMGLINTYAAVILPYITFGIPISVLILRGFFEQIPKELRDASKVDGAGDLLYFIKIVLPISKPAIAACIIFLFLQTWNEFLLALVFLRNDLIQTVPVTVAKIGGGAYIIPWGIYGAAIVISTIPVVIVFLIFQKWFIRGITMGAIKG